MKKLLTVSLLAALLSIPSIVLADATWYGSIRAGVASEPREGGGDSIGVDDAFSRWGIKGWNRVAEGLIAVYRFETRIDSTDASQPEGNLAWVGLRGKLGTLLLGKVWSASYASVGLIIDRSLVYGQPETTYRISDAGSYIVKFGKLRLQADLIMKGGTSKAIDSFQFGAKIGGLMDSGSVAFAHIRHADSAVVIGGYPSGTQQVSSNYLVGEYGIGDTTMYLGAGKHSAKNNGCLTVPQIAQNCIKKGSRSSTYGGVRGDLGETGLKYYIQVVNKKVKSTNNSRKPVTTRSSTTPWLLGISRSLGGGTSVHFETSNPDEDGVSNSTGIWLRVDF